MTGMSMRVNIERTQCKGYNTGGFPRICKNNSSSMISHASFNLCLGLPIYKPQRSRGPNWHSPKGSNSWECAWDLHWGLWPIHVKVGYLLCRETMAIHHPWLQRHRNQMSPNRINILADVASSYRNAQDFKLRMFAELLHVLSKLRVVKLEALGA